MINLKILTVLTTHICACDYEYVIDQVKQAVKNKKKLLISPLASQTLVKAYFDKNLQKVLEKFDGLYPDSQWVKRTLFFLYGVYLKERVYGPELMLRVCQLAVKYKYRIFLYGTTERTLIRLKKSLLSRFPLIKIVDYLPSKFTPLQDSEKKSLIKKIERKKTDILFVSLGSPLEQIFVYQLVYKAPKLRNPIIIIPVGAAFDFITGVKLQAPKWVQNLGFEWLFRLITEPKRLWKRYLIYGPLFVVLVLIQKIGIMFGKD